MLHMLQEFAKDTSCKTMSLKQEHVIETIKYAKAEFIR